MHSDRIPESTKQWLQNEDFILWCLAPTQESEEWWVNYQKEHPEDQASLQEARKIMLSARLNPVQRLPEESERYPLCCRLCTNIRYCFFLVDSFFSDVRNC